MDSPPGSIDRGASRADDGLAAFRPSKLVLDESGHVGDALRAARESLGLDVDDIALATHVRASFIAAVEALDLAALPSGPFATGYVKAYARALGLDPAEVAARFRREVPHADVELASPMGLRASRWARLRRLAATTLVVVSGLAAWNLMVRIPSLAPRQAPAPVAPLRATPTPGPTVLGAPLPAPADVTSPPPYETPGLAAAAARNGADAAAAVTARIAAEAEAARPVNPVPPGTAFAPHGETFGAGGGPVVLQAVRPASLIIRNGGAILFARELAAGQAWRAPPTAGLVADVDAPRALEAYVGGKAVGALPAGWTPLADLKAPADPAK